jgi:hypothetical protein
MRVSVACEKVILTSHGPSNGFVAAIKTKTKNKRRRNGVEKMAPY